MPSVDQTSKCLRPASIFAPFLLLFLWSCGGGLSGKYINLSDTKDTIEFLGADRAHVTAIAGQRLDVWDRGQARTSFGKQLSAAREAVRSLEQVEVRYQRSKDGKRITFSADGRGSRSLIFDPQSNSLSEAGGRKYFKK